MMKPHPVNRIGMDGTRDAFGDKASHATVAMQCYITFMVWPNPLMYVWFHHDTFIVPAL